MKKIILLYWQAILFLFAAVIIFAAHAFGAYNPSVSSTNSFSYSGGTKGQLLTYSGSSTAPITVVPNCFATTSPSGSFQVNCGLYSNYPNPSGMFNLYDESTTSPVLSASFMASTSQYAQIFGQNLNPAGSMDLVFADDKGNATSTSHYMDVGMANSKQSDGDHTLILPYDAYFYNQSNRVLIGTATTSASSSIIMSLGMQSGSPNFTLDRYGHIITQGASGGALSGCGTSPTQTGNDNNGVITLGTGLSVTACTKAFANPFPSTSTVSCSITSGNSLSTPSLTAVSTTGFTVGLSISLGGGKIYYQCIASQ